jgi:acetylornithine deacetylase/succinyl-diaminopimelate desuccinylase family protein
MQNGVLQTLADLVAINSVNSAYDGGVTEEEVALYVETFFAGRGIETFRQDVAPGRFNVIARLDGRQPGRRVILEAHMDTVSVSGMSIAPFEPRIEGGLLYGRGSCDTKAGLASMMHAVAGLREGGIVPPCEVWLAAVVDEEYSFRGVTRLCEGLQAQAAIVAEPTELRAVIASKGVLRWKIRTLGKAAHSAKPHLGVSAIQSMAHVLLALEEEAGLLSRKVNTLLGPATLSVGVIRGGEQINFVPDRCEIWIDRRLLPGEDPHEVWRAAGAMLEKLRAEKPELIFEMDPPSIADGAMETSATDAVVQVAQDVLRSNGGDPAPAGVPFGSDASKLSRQGVPSIIFGPGSIDRAHAAVEYVECDQVVSALSFYTEFLRRFE